MTAERANDKCESCGKQFRGIQRHVDFTDELLCPVCMVFYAPHVVKEYVMEDPTDR